MNLSIPILDAVDCSPARSRGRSAKAELLYRRKLQLSTLFRVLHLAIDNFNWLSTHSTRISTTFADYRQPHLVLSTTSFLHRQLDFAIDIFAYAITTSLVLSTTLTDYRKLGQKWERSSSSASAAWTSPATCSSIPKRTATLASSTR